MVVIKSDWKGDIRRISLEDKNITLLKLIDILKELYKNSPRIFYIYYMNEKKKNLISTEEQFQEIVNSVNNNILRISIMGIIYFFFLYNKYLSRKYGRTSSK